MSTDEPIPLETLRELMPDINWMDPPFDSYDHRAGNVAYAIGTMAHGSDRERPLLALQTLVQSYNCQEVERAANTLRALFCDDVDIEDVNYMARHHLH